MGAGAYDDDLIGSSRAANQGAMDQWGRVFAGPIPGSRRDQEQLAGKGRGVTDWLGDALTWLKEGVKTGGSPPPNVIEGATRHLKANGGFQAQPAQQMTPGNEGGARMMPGPDQAASSPVGASPLGAQPDFKDTNYPGSARQDQRQQPVAGGPSGRSGSNGTGRGNGVTPSKPGKTTGYQPVTQAPRSSDPAATSTAVGDDVTKDPAVQSLTALLKKYTAGGNSQVDLSPLAALSDSWSKGHLLSGYDRPMSDADKSKLTAQLAENLARRQSDIEYHKARMAMYGDKNQAFRDVGMGRNDINARIHGVDPEAGQGDPNFLAPPKPAPIPKAGKGGPKPPTPEQESKAAFSANSGILGNVINMNYSGAPGAVKGATQDVHQQLDQVARRYQAQGHAPDYKTAYQMAVQDLPEMMRQGKVSVRGMRYHGANQPQPQGGDGGSE